MYDCLNVCAYLIHKSYFCTLKANCIISEIKAFLIDHPGISVRWLEQQVSVSLGTIRITGVKPVPEKYIQPIIDVLMPLSHIFC